MRPAENIEKFIKNIDIDTNAKMDQAVLDDILKALEKSKTKKSTAPQPNIWRIIMKSKITKLATAAVVIIAVSAGIYHLAASRSDYPSTFQYPALNAPRAPQQHSAHTEREVKMGLPSIAQDVARSSVIVRAKFLEQAATGRRQGDMVERKLNVQVIKVLYGKVPTQIIEVIDWYGPELGGKQPGVEVIMFLHKFQGQYRCGTTYFHAPPEHSLDAREKAILEVIESGAHLTAPPVGTRY